MKKHIRVPHVSIPIPRLLKDRPTDARGYPIPFVAYVDDAGRPHFTVSDTRRVSLCLKGDFCGLCGCKLYRHRWFVGGGLSAFDSVLYVDPPMHKDCAEYALQVCPYIAAPNYSKRLDDATLKKGDVVVEKDEAVVDDRPEVFVAVMGIESELRGGHVSPKFKRIADVQFWRHGTRLEDQEGAKIAGAELARRKGIALTGEASLIREKKRITLNLPR